MTGLMAVIATPGAKPVSEQEIEALLNHYQLIRPSARPTRRAANDRARVVTFDDDLTDGPSATSPSWIMHTGSMHPAVPWTNRHTEELKIVDGQFAVVSYDAANDEVLVANDPMGMHALFVAESGTRLYVSTSSLALARYLRPPASRLGLREFLLSGYHFGHRTHWDAIRRVNPATCIIRRADGMSEQTYWRPVVDPAIRSLAIERASEHAISVARNACVQHLTGQPVWADLTGGYDSRLLCLLLESAGVDFATNTRSAPEPDDTDLACRIAGQKDWTWLDNRLPSSWPLILPDLLESALAWGDGQLEVLQLARVLYAHRRLAQQGPPRLLSAGGGEHFQYYAWQSEFLNAGRSSTFDLYRWIDMLALKPTNVGVFATDPRSEVRADFAERIRNWIKPYADEPNTMQLDIAYAYKSMGHFGAYRSADDAELRAELPFFFKPVVSTAMSTDHRHRNGHRLMRHMIETLDAQVAGLPTTRGGPALPWRFSRAHRYLPYVGVVGRKGINKVTQRALGRPLLARSTSFGWQQAAHGAVLASLQRAGTIDWSNMRIGSLLDRAAVESLMTASMRAGFGDSAMLGRIITAEMALRSTDTALG